MKMRKINRGLILTVLVVAGVAAYLVGLDVRRSDDRKNISNLCYDYFPVYAQTVMLTDAQCGGTYDEFNAKLDSLKSQAKEKIAPYYSETDCTKATVSQLENYYAMQNTAGTPVTRCELNVRSVDNFVFDGDVATAKAVYSLAFTGPAAASEDGSVMQTGESRETTGSSTLTFRKDGGSWKIYYFDGSLNIG